MGDFLGKITDPGDFLGAQSSKAAQETSADLGYKTLEMQKEWMDYIKGMYEPYHESGLWALQNQRGMIDELNAPIDYEAIQKGPEYAAMSQAANQNLMANQEAMGGMGSTSTGNALGANTFNILNQLGQQQKMDTMNQFNAYGAMSGQGMQGGNSLGSFGGNTLSGMAGTMSGIGTGAMNAAAMKQQQGTGLLSAGVGLLSMFSDIRLKDNIKATGEKSSKGHEIYTWDWNEIAEGLGLTGSGKGVIADKVELKDPEAITIDESGYKKVDYARV
ncbi:putative DNA transfer protein [Vibrio phage 199E37-1]|nr:putative DNA transfer protein [Vibrio phage 199E37-1]